MDSLIKYEQNKLSFEQKNIEEDLYRFNTFIFNGKK